MPKVTHQSSVPSKVRNCAEPPDHLRSEISFSRTCNIPNLISCLYRIELLPLVTLHQLRVHMVAQLHAHQNKHLLSVKFS